MTGCVSGMAVDIVQTWLYTMQVEFDLDVDNGVFVTEWPIDDRKFEMYISCRADGWIQISALLVRDDRIPPAVKEALYAELLKENRRLDDVTYSMDEEGNLYAENDVPVHSNLGNFLTELNAVVYAVKRFKRNVAQIFGLGGALDSMVE